MEDEKLKKSPEIEPIQGLGSKGNEEPPTRYPIEEPEGINTSTFPRTYSSTDYNIVTDAGAVSLTQIEVLDLLSEGVIEGLVTGEYDFTRGTIGSVGYNSVPFTPYPSVSGVQWLRSIYWNDVPVVDSNNRFNFSSINVQFTPGSPNGAVTRLKEDLTVTRPLGERLRFGNDFIKIYRIVNKNCKSVEVNVKVTSLSMTVVGRSFDGNSSQAYYYQNEQPKVTPAGLFSEIGDVEATAVHYRIFKRPVFSDREPPNFEFAIEEEIYGKVTFGYIKKTRVVLQTTANNYEDQDGFIGWEIKIQRLTPDSISGSIRNVTYIDSITEIFGDVYTYPHSAIVASKFSAEYFSQIPNRSYDVKLLKVKVPDNYDPITKKYNPEPWNGSFADDRKWTDNPAWCFYDILTSKRYGLGRYIDENLIDKWTLYDIAKYCDTLVPDGYGKFEPRFTCNLILNSREEAYRVINDMASIFRAMVYYSAGSIYAVQDSQKDDFTWQFTNANVENGDFTYSSSSRRVRHTVAIVRYNDKTNMFKPAVEYVEDIEGIKRYGIREVELTAFGCTSRGQALRLGKWALLSEILETESVSFVAGLEGAYLRPGDVFKVFDSNRRATRKGGRTKQITHSGDYSIVRLDDYVSGLTPSQQYSFSLLTPTYNYDPSLVSGDLTSADVSSIRRRQIQVQSFLGASGTVVTGTDSGVYTEIVFPKFSTGDYLVSGNLVWTLDASGISESEKPIYDYYRALRIEEKENNRYVIAGIQYEGSKFRAIESGLNFEDTHFNKLPPPPTNLNLAIRPVTANTKLIDYDFKATESTGVTKGFLVFAKTGDFQPADVTGTSFLATTLPSTVTSGVYFPAITGQYFFRVYAVNKFGQRSSYIENNILVSDINPIRDVIINSLMLDTGVGTNNAGERTNVIIDTASPSFRWQAGLSVGNFETATNFAYKLTIRKTGNTNVPSTHIYYTTGNLSTNYFNFDIDKNILAVSNQGVRGPFRNYDVVVEAVDANGQSSAGDNFSNPQGYDILGVQNPRIQLNLTNGACAASAATCTEQWFTPDSDVRILLTRYNTINDLAGGFLYTSLTPFTKDEALRRIPHNKTIVQNQFTNIGNPLVVPVSGLLTGAKTAYIGLSLYDTFDDAVINNNGGADISTGLYLSNIVKINRVGGFDKGAYLFKSWVSLVTQGVTNSAGQVGVPGTPVIAPLVTNAWQTRSAGISNVVATSYVAPLDMNTNYANTLSPNAYYSEGYQKPEQRNVIHYKYDIYFTKALASTDYAVIVSVNPPIPTVKIMSASTFPYHYPTLYQAYESNDFFRITKRTYGLTLDKLYGPTEITIGVLSQSDE